MPDAVTATVIVPTRDRPGYLATTLASLAAQDPVTGGMEVIVVDDGSSDAAATELAVERAQGEGGPPLRLLRRPGEGPNAARNRGMEAAGGALLVLIDDDVLAPPAWLRAYVDGAGRHPDSDMFGGPIEARLEGRARRTCGREGPPITLLDLGPVDREAVAVWSANMAVRRSAFERIGGLKEEAGYYSGEEEVEWQERLQAASGHVTYLAEARLYHRRDARDAGLGRLCREAYRRGRRLRAYDLRKPGHDGLVGELRTLAGCALHGLRYRCANGPPLTAAAAGRVVETLASARRGPR